jgi:predicted nucleotidyltransferase
MVGINRPVLPVRVKAELDKLTALISEALPVDSIYLFGSYAYGKPNKDSDLDLYVVYKDDVPLRELDAGLVARLAIARKKNMAVDICARHTRDFLAKSKDITLERIVKRDGVKIYG